MKPQSVICQYKHLISIWFLTCFILIQSFKSHAQTNEFLLESKPEPFLQTPKAEPKSPVVGAALSFLLPGLGEVYAGNFETGRYFLGAEVAMLLGVGTLWIRGSSYESNYQLFAQQNAGVSGNKTTQFWRDISSYNSVDEFNADRLRARDFGRLYDRQTDFWDWTTEANRRGYRDLRIRSDEAYQSIYYLVAAMGINRLLSMINAVRKINTHNFSNGFEELEETEASIYVIPQNSTLSIIPVGIRAEFRWSF